MMKSFFIASLIFILVPFNLTGQSKEETELVILDSVSTHMDDSSPIVQPETNDLIFSRVNENGDKDLMFAKWTGKNWRPAKSYFSRLNNRFDNEICAFGNKGEVYFQKAIVNPAGNAIYGIFKSRYTNGAWESPVKQQIKYFNNKSSDQSFCMSKDGQIMLISMQSYFSYGVEDIYVSFRRGENNWTEPKNLGRTINTKYEEFTPYLDEDNRTLYFSSNGHENGFGSKDIWVSYRLDSTWTNWTKPLNLGPEVNTVGMEMSFTKTGIKEIPYLVVSSRSSDGQSDIYGLQLKKEKLDSILKLIIPKQAIQDKLNQSPENNFIDTANSGILIDTLSIGDSLSASLLDSNENVVSINVINKDNGKSIPARVYFQSRNKNDSVFVNKDSTVEISFDWLDTVNFEIVSDNFFSLKTAIIFENRHFGIHLKEEFALDSLVIGKSIKLEHVLFKRGTPELLEESFVDLDYVIEILSKDPGLDIEIAGHTDNSGNAYLNYVLSEKRAKTIKKYMVDNGIEPDRISTKGYGGSRPIASNESEETMKLNRRVEFKLLRK